MELIDREKAIDAIGHINAEWGNDNLSLIDQCEALEKIKDLPTVDAEPVRHGEWIMERTTFYCSKCGDSHKLSMATNPQRMKYCSKCGAKMDAERREG